MLGTLAFCVGLYVSNHINNKTCLPGQKQPPEVFCEKGVLRKFTKFTGKHLCQSLFFKNETLAQVFSCEFCENSKNTFFTEHLWATASSRRQKFEKKCPETSLNGRPNPMLINLQVH